MNKVLGTILALALLNGVIWQPTVGAWVATAVIGVFGMKLIVRVYRRVFRWFA